MTIEKPAHLSQMDAQKPAHLSQTERKFPHIWITISAHLSQRKSRKHLVL